MATGSQDLAQSDQYVIATLDDGTKLHTRYLVGADGMHSTVRDHVGIGFPGGSYGESFSLADLRLRANTRPDIRAAIVIGSRARVERPADEWSDLDIIVFTTAPEYYLSKVDWLENIGTPLLNYLHRLTTTEILGGLQTGV